EVEEELKKDSKAHKQWIKFNKKCKNKIFIDLEEGEAECMPKIEAPSIYRDEFFNKKKNRNTTLEEEWGYGSTAADPLLICHGIYHGSTVVTMESPNKGHNIPDVCHRLNVKSIGLERFLTEVEEFCF
ncbi:MAG: DUF4411 family protein, partial [Methanobrevibacter sp.]